VEGEGEAHRDRSRRSAGEEASEGEGGDPENEYAGGRDDGRRGRRRGGSRRLCRIGRGDGPGDAHRQETCEEPREDGDRMPAGGQK
jgi:hypothetical protein